MKLITEHNENVKHLITESADGKKQHFIEGVFMQAEKQNRNNRVYPKPVLEKAVADYVRESVATGRAVGELNHPDGPTINLDKVSHLITDLSWKGNDVIGKAKILETPMGQIVKGLLDGGCQLGVSSRGMGTVGESGGNSTVNEDFVLSTVDIVQDPSAPSAFVEGIMEGVEYFYEGNNIVAMQADEYHSRMKRLSTKKLAEQQTKLFTNFLSEIKVKL